MEAQLTTCLQSDTESSSIVCRCDDPVRDVVSEIETPNVMHSATVTRDDVPAVQAVDEDLMTSAQETLASIRIKTIEEIDAGSGDAGESPMELKVTPDAPSDEGVKAPSIMPPTETPAESTTPRDTLRDDAVDIGEPGIPRSKLRGLVPVVATEETLSIQQRLLRLLKQRESQRDIEHINSDPRRISKSIKNSPVESAVVERGDTWKRMISCLSGCWNQKQDDGNDEEREQYVPLFPRDEAEPSTRSSTGDVLCDGDDVHGEGCTTIHETRGVVLGHSDM